MLMVLFGEGLIVVSFICFVLYFSLVVVGITLDLTIGYILAFMRYITTNLKGKNSNGKANR